MDGHEKRYIEVNRIAEVGELIKVTRKEDACYVGSTYKVISNGTNGSVYIRTKEISRYVGDMSDRHIKQPFTYIRPDSYVVLEIKKRGKSSYSEEEIKKAKEIIGDMIDECSGSEIIRFFSDGNMVYASVGAEIVTAKCSKNDVPNEWIGKCVALCKALHRPIPSFIAQKNKED